MRASNAIKSNNAGVERLSRSQDTTPRDEDGTSHLQAIYDSAIGVEYLQRVTGKEDLSLISFLQLRVDLNVQSVLYINEILPSLTSLVLDESVMSSIRDLGTGLRCLLSLSINSCGLYDLDGVGVLSSLQDLSACDNFITDVAPLAMHDSLQVYSFK